MLSVFYDEQLNEIFLYSFLFLITIGCLMWFTSRQKDLPLNISDGFIITTMFWVVLACAGSIPFYFFGLSANDAIF